MSSLSSRGWPRLLRIGLVFAWLLGTGLAEAAPRRVVRVGVFTFYPAIHWDPQAGKAKGFYADMLRELAAKKEWELQFVPGSWSEGLERVQKGEVDLLTSVAYSRERDGFLSFGKEPSFTVWSLLYTSPDLRIQSILEVAGRRVGVMRGDMNGMNFRKLCEGFKITCTFEELDSFEDILGAIAARRVDAGVTPSTFGYAKEHEFKVYRSPVVVAPFDIFFATAKGRNEDLLADLDAYLLEGKADPRSGYQRAIDQWLFSHTDTALLPSWVAKAGFASLFILLGSWGLLLVFRRQVKAATAEARCLNAGLEHELAIRRQSEEALRESRQFSEQIIRNAQEGVIVYGLDLRYQMWNPYMEQLTGIPAEAVLGRHPSEVFPFLRDEGVLDRIERALAGETVGPIDFQFTVPGTGKSGWTSDTSAPFRDATGEIIGVIGTVSDITERKRLEESRLFLAQAEWLATGEDFFLALARFLAGHLAMDYVCIDRLVGEGLSAQTLAIWFDGQFEDNVEYTLKDTPCGDVVGKTICSFPSGVRHQFPQDQVLQDMRAESYLGTTLWGSEGKPIGLIALIGRSPVGNPRLAEATLALVALRAAAELEHRQAEEALLAKSAEVERYFTSSLDLLCIADQGGHFLRLNPEWKRVLGYSIQELENHSFLDLVHPEDLEGTLGAMARLRSQEQVISFVNRYRCQDGSYRWIEWRSQPQGQLIYAAARDITERVRAEEETLRLQGQLQQSQKMESLGLLAGGVAHDMNNVLGAILGLASATIEGQPPASPVHRAFETIIKAAERGGKMVRALLSFARQSPAEERELDLNAILQEEVRLLERTTLSKVHLELDLAPDLRPIRGDASALTHAFMNLCVNAVDAMPERGTLALRTRNVDSDWIEVVVEDTGTGMTGEVLKRALDPFFTTKEQGKGTGLGLSMVYGTVKVHQGEMEIQSESGQGTRVRLRFPAYASEAGPQEAPVVPGSGSRGALKVLLVDDDELIQSSMLAILDTLGHEPTAVTSGEEALARIGAGYEPDLMILDMNMPGLGGAGTLRHLRALKPQLPVLLSTGRADQKALDLLQAYPFVTLLSKPFSLKEFQQHLAELGWGDGQGF